MFEAVNRVLPAVRADLERLIRIPSVSSQAQHDEDVIAAAGLVAELLHDAGASEVQTLTAGGKPAVLATFHGPKEAPVVLLYAHYDVQPTGDASAWSSDPFEPQERGGRLYARGSADDKGGLAVHLAALRAFEGKPPVTVKVFAEGEEEIGSPTMPALLEAHGEALAADVFVIADSINWRVGVPALTTSLRGLVDATVTVSTLHTGLHSGGFGGVVPDALTTLCRLLATLHDEQGNVAIEGLASAPDPDIEYPEERLRAETGLLEGVSWIGDGPATARLWTKPAVAVLAIDATPVGEVSNTLSPSARAVVSVRLAPNDDPQRAQQALNDHLRRHAPWGARVEIESGRGSGGSAIDLSDPRAQAAVGALREAFGVAPVSIGVGGSIPIVAEFAQRNPGALVLVTAVTDPTSAMHGIDESLDLADFGKAAHAEALLLQKLGRI